MRRTAVITTSAAAALAAAGILAVSGGAQQPGGRTIELVSKNCTFKLLDNPPLATQARPTTSIGDTYALRCTVTDRDGERLGNVDAACTTTKGGRRDVAVCQGAYQLENGELYLQTRMPERDIAETHGAIVGGFGDYAGARGTFTSVDRAGERNGDPSDDTITLLP